jgi:hypothetical protein
MTHLTVRLTGASHHAAASSPGKKTLSVATQSFADQLSQAFAETLSKFGIDPKSVKLTLEDTSSQTNVTGQNSVTASNASVVGAAGQGLNALVAAATTAAAVTPAPAPAAAIDTAQSASEAYWSKQPAAVQQLRHIDDYGQRAMLAGQLAAQGYSIDVPVMVWGWDASKTTQLRQGFGYTWIPSAMQPQVSAAPGISGGAIIPYDPAHPPVGSILV